VEHHSVGTISFTLSAEKCIIAKVAMDSVEIQIRIISRIVRSSTTEDAVRGFPVIPQRTFTLKMVLHTKILVVEHPVYIIFKSVNTSVPQNA